MKLPRLLIPMLAPAFVAAAALAQTEPAAEVWLTNVDRSSLFQPQVALSVAEVTRARGGVIAVDETKTYQPIDGFGFALTQGSAKHIIAMTPAARAALLKELFGTEGSGIGISYLRVSIGASDLNDRVFSYDDVPAGQSDPELKQFDLGPDRRDVIPVLKEILAIAPTIKILGSPWSAPAWMKTNGAPKGGQLKPECEAAYAQYFVKYIQAMQAEGIRIDAITPQNEPLHPGNLPSMVVPAEQEAEFVREHLGPAFKAAGIATKIIVWDHNCNHPEYPISILRDPAAAAFVDGSGFHLYEGKIDAMTEVHDAFPQKNLYFTEQMVTEPAGQPAINIGVPVRRIVFGALHNWSRNVLLWNLAADANFDPHTNDGGCTMCQGAITIEGDKVTRNLAYYTLAHVSKFVRPGSVRIESTDSEMLPNVAFRTPDGGAVVVVLNNGWTDQRAHIRYHNRQYSCTLHGGTVATVVIHGQ